MTATVEVRPHPVVRVIWGIVRILTAGAMGYAVLTTAIVRLAAAADEGGHLPTVAGNAFASFTVAANILGALAFFLGGLWLLARSRSPRQEPRWLSLFLLSTSAYLILTAIVTLTLSGPSVSVGALVMTAVAPVLFLADVLLRVGRRPQPARWVWLVLLFPAAWVAATMVRGELVTDPASGTPWWYPNVLVDPYVQPVGYLSVALWVLLAAGACAGIGAAAAWWSRAGRTASP